MPVRNNSIDFFSAVKFSAIQDTTITSGGSLLNLSADTSLLKNTNKNIIELGNKSQFKLGAIDSIMRRSEERERQIHRDTIKEIFIQRPVVYRKTADTTEMLYKQFGIAGFPLQENLEKDVFNQNFLYNIQSIKPVKKKIKQNVFIESENTGVKKKINYHTQKEFIIKPKYTSRKVNFDWITILLLASLLLIGWVRLFNKKYLKSLIKSLINYKESNALYREKNSVMEKTSFLVNLLFINNLSIFCLQLKHYYNFSIEGMEDYTFYFAVFASFIGFNILRLIFAAFIGSLFLKQKFFSEYIHNVFLFTKNTGLFLFPVIIILQFLPFDNLDFITFTGLAIILVMYSIQLIRAFQIIIRKNLSIFFMILYLCAFEFTPFLVIYKVFLSQVY